jgi:hypothetical protein
VRICLISSALRNPTLLASEMLTSTLEQTLEAEAGVFHNVTAMTR